MQPEQGERGLWYVGTVGFATKEEAQAYIDRGMKHFDGVEPPSKQGLVVRSKGWVWFLALALVVIVALGWHQLYYMSDTQVASRQAKDAANTARMQEIKLQRLVRGFVGGHLKDAGSAEFKNQYGLCGEVNAKNSFGAFTGYRRFIAKSERMVILEGDGLITAVEFGELWDQACRTSPVK